jgi:hypothetical protein
MMQPYAGDDYLDFPALEAAIRDLAARHPDHVKLEEIGRSREGRPLLLLTLATDLEAAGDNPALWLDGGTHAAEWTGMMAALYSAEQWAAGLAAGDEKLTAWFSRHTAYVLPCISTDGFHAMCEGHPFIRSSTRPPREGTLRVGLEPCDVNGDGQVLFMRWRDPAGPFVPNPDQEWLMRHRTLDDDPAEAFFLCIEGEFTHWDGVRWTAAPRKYGLDLNRNFPGSWAPFSMFGMDGGAYPLSEPTSRAVVDAVHARPNIALAVTHHTYTGCLLTQPYREPSILGKSDIELMERLAKQMVDGTGHKVHKVVPDFTYDKDNTIVGVWADTLSTVFGIPGYTMELWNPYGFAGVEVESPALFFAQPDPKILEALCTKFAEEPGRVTPWTPFEHPQLGPVEIGGFDHRTCLRNPPVELLPAECGRGHRIADQALRALPDLHTWADITEVAPGVHVVEMVLANQGFLSTSALAHAETLGTAPPLRVDLHLGTGLELVEGEPARTAGHLDGWGEMQAGSARHGLSPSLPRRGHQIPLRWVVKGTGELTLSWLGGRAGSGELQLEVG